LLADRRQPNGRTNGATTIERMNSNLDRIRELLEQDHVCREIADYLARHSDAVDTAVGIAEWWVNCDLAATEVALFKLVDHGIVRPCLVQGRASMFAYTTDHEIRESVSRYLGHFNGSAPSRSRRA
jgi:hypothetical protein